MMRRLLLLALLAGLSLPVPAALGQVAVSARVGSLGPGGELTAGLSGRLNLRLAGHYFGYSRSDEFTDADVTVRADADVQLASGAAFLDVHPFGNSFRLSAGLVYNANEVHVLATPLTSVTIDDKTFAPEKIGTLNATMGHQAALHPYAGLGFGNAVRGSRVGLLFDLGVLYTDDPRFEAEGTGLIAPTALQAGDIEADLAGLQLYPVVSLGLSVRL